MLDPTQTDLLEYTNNVSTGSAMEVIGFNEAAFSWRYDDDTDATSTPKDGRFTLRVENELIFMRGGINLITGPTGSGMTTRFH